MALEAVGKALGEQNGNKNKENEENGENFPVWWICRSSSPKSNMIIILLLSSLMLDKLILSLADT